MKILILAQSCEFVQILYTNPAHLAQLVAHIGLCSRVRRFDSCVLLKSHGLTCELKNKLMFCTTSETEGEAVHVKLV